MLGGIPTGDAESGVGLALWRAADARFGVEGLPQSGTGQTALLTGVNAPARLGRHFGPWVHTQLRPLLAAENLLTRTVAAGRVAAFANATPASQAGTAGGKWRRPAAPPLAAYSAGLHLPNGAELRARRAVASSITNEKWREFVDPSIPEITAGEAGMILGSMAGDASLTLFAHYDTDLVGHRGSYSAAVSVLERVDAFFGGLMQAIGPSTLLVIASDHGNVEDVDVGHTLNRVPVIARGPGAQRLVARIHDIADVAPAILHALGI
jgi:2,3-bisphosphoglycerate-independent phosphoglycerate mutase